jgi:aerobic-type carbon monoxide dehydrogenase small subunit (CoxS/CutS family)
MSKDVSRRAFLRTTAGATAGTAMTVSSSAIDGSSAVAQTAIGEPARKDTLRVTLAVNGTPRTVDIAPSMTLAQVLRGRLRLTGTKIACNRGACSACTVLLDGAPVCSCMLLAVDVGTRHVTTIEGLADGEELHPVQAAFVEHDALQCGFCTPGMVLSCAALLDRNPSPSAEEVKGAIAGHYCRCGTYPHVVEATLAAAIVRKG